MSAHPWYPGLFALVFAAASNGGCGRDAAPTDAPDAEIVTEPVAVTTPDGAVHYYTGALGASRAFVFFPGSSGETASYPEILRAVGSLPDVLALALQYCNEHSLRTLCDTYCADAANVCTCLDLCFENGREIRVHGAASSPIPRAAELCPPGEEILTRLPALLATLGATQFLSCVGSSCEVRWDRLVLAGSSQGAGMATYLGLQYRVQRVNQYSGTADTVACAGEEPRPATWITRIPVSGKTPPTDHYGLFHTGDLGAPHFERIYETIGMPGEWYQIESSTDAWGHKNRTSNDAACCPGIEPSQECRHGCPSKNPLFAPYWKGATGF